MNTRVGELSLEELKALIDDAVDSRLAEHLGDPDVGLDVKPEFVERIRKSRRAPTVPAEEIAKRLGLKW